MKLRKLGLLAIMGLGLFSLAACGSASNDSDPTNPSGQTSGEGEGQGGGQQGGGSQGGGSQGGGQSTTPVITNTTDGVEISLVSGAQESLYAEFSPVTNATAYNVYYKSSTDTDYIKADAQLTRLYKDGDNYYYRSDVVGLKNGTYALKIVPVIESAEVEAKASLANNLSVISYDRSGFGFVEGTSSGAYNNDGTLKSNAVVLYISEDTKDTVTMDVVTNNKGATTSATGLQNIINLYKKGYDSRPLNVRFIGQITDLAVMEGGDICISGSGSSSRVSCGITFEGIGKDATIDGFGIRVKNASNVEVRNLAFMNCDSSEGDDCGLQQDNDHIWVHNCDFFYGGPGGDSDQAKGDGALDCKKSTYVSFAYNHFWDTGKSNLLGLSEGTTSGLFITYHHNWYDHSDSRHPRVRYYTCHVYNNYYDGNSKYGVGSTLGSSVFVENNYFRNCKFPIMTSMQGSDIYASATTADLKNNPTFSKEAGGSVKSFGNTMVGNYTYIPYGCSTYVNKGSNIAFDLADTTSNVNFDAYEASTRSETVPSTVVARDGSATYNNFDTASTMYSYTVQSPEDAKNTVMQYAGRIQGGDFKWTFTDADDTSYAVNQGLKTALTSYKTKLVSVQGIESSSGSGTNDPGQNPSTQTITVAEVEALIAALPEPTSVTASHRSQIEAAETAYNKLSSDDQNTVSNKQKLLNCLDALNNLPQGAEVCTFPYSGSFFSVTGSTSNSKGNVTYNGATYSICLKMESSTKVEFTTTASTTLTIVFGNADKMNINLTSNGTTTKYTADANGVVTVTIEAGSYTLAKADATNVYYISIA